MSLKNKEQAATGTNHAATGTTRNPGGMSKMKYDLKPFKLFPNQENEDGLFASKDQTRGTEDLRWSE